MDQAKFINKLLETGVAKTESPMDIHEINKLLRPASFFAVKWADGQTFILKDLHQNLLVDPPYSQQSAIAARKIIEQLSRGERVSPSIALSMLEENGWVRMAGRERAELTERALVQYDDLIESMKGIYKRCKICKLLVKYEDAHKECIFKECN
ncbi:hypothetical protein ENBRE01_1393 [Enteropsectra breve]|nr:hypothetical protein ENBRE01_1393 [Enteropsectra breve]